MTAIRRLCSLLLSLLLLPFRDPWRTVVGQRCRFDVDASRLRPAVAPRLVPAPAVGSSPGYPSTADVIKLSIPMVVPLVAVYLRLRDRHQNPTLTLSAYPALNLDENKLVLATQQAQARCPVHNKDYHQSPPCNIHPARLETGIGVWRTSWSRTRQPLLRQVLCTQYRTSGS